MPTASDFRPLQHVLVISESVAAAVRCGETLQRLIVDIADGRDATTGIEMPLEGRSKTASDDTDAHRLSRPARARREQQTRAS